MISKIHTSEVGVAIGGSVTESGSISLLSIESTILKSLHDRENRYYLFDFFHTQMIHLFLELGLSRCQIKIAIYFKLTS